jgi:hypothetical protein
MKLIEKSLTTSKQSPTLNNLRKTQRLLHAFASHDARREPERFRLYSQLLSVVSGRIRNDSDQRRTTPKASNYAPLPRGLKSDNYTGVAPEEISDPKLRKEYEDAIAENARRAKFWEEQHGLDEVRDQVTGILGVMAINLYRKDDAGAKKLKQELAEHGVPSELIAHILKTYKRWKQRFDNEIE